MSMANPSAALPGERRAEILALGFGVTTAMWTLAYLSRLLPALLPPPLLFFLFLVCLLLGGAMTGCHTERGVRGGIGVGGLASLLNLLILGSVLGGDMPGEVKRAAMIWVPGSLVVGMALGALGAAIGVRRARSRGGAAPPAMGWNAAFASVTAATTLLLLGAGGLVTSQEAGLAVVDWPNSYGYNMFLYPLAKMTGGIFYEHAHRLLGSLVGLATLVLTLHLQGAESRRWMKALAWAALLLVIVQGVMGGLRVTGRFTMSQSPEAMAPSIVLAVLHGVLGQIFFGLLLAIAAFSSRAWLSTTAVARSTGLTDRQLAPILIAVVWVQLILGALLRHLAVGTMWHVSFAMIVLLVGVAVGARNWGLYRGLPALRPAGRALTILLGVQLLLGTGALAAVMGTPDPVDIPWWEVTLTTFHQMTGAVILGLAVLLTVWTRRLLLPDAD